jgi:hypothetical protein
MFEDLDWKAAFKKAAFAAVLYVLFVYVMSVAFPESFGANSSITATLAIAGLFFFVYAPVFAFSERRKRRRRTEMNAEKNGKKLSATAKVRTNAGATADDEQVGTDTLRGRQNPNTSRKKTARRRRR